MWTGVGETGNVQRRARGLPLPHAWTSHSDTSHRTISGLRPDCSGPTSKDIQDLPRPGQAATLWDPGAVTGGAPDSAHARMVGSELSGGVHPSTKPQRYWPRPCMPAKHSPPRLGSDPVRYRRAARPPASRCHRRSSPTQPCPGTEGNPWGAHSAQGSTC